MAMMTSSLLYIAAVVRVVGVVEADVGDHDRYVDHVGFAIAIGGGDRDRVFRVRLVVQRRSGHKLTGGRVDCEGCRVCAAKLVGERVAAVGVHCRDRVADGRASGGVLSNHPGSGGSRELRCRVQRRRQALELLTGAVGASFTSMTVIVTL